MFLHVCLILLTGDDIFGLFGLRVAKILGLWGTKVRTSKL